MLYANRWKKLPAEVRANYKKQARALRAVILEAHTKQALLVLPTGTEVVIDYEPIS